MHKASNTVVNRIMGTETRKIRDMKIVSMKGRMCSVTLQRKYSFHVSIFHPQVSNCIKKRTLNWWDQANFAYDYRRIYVNSMLMQLKQCFAYKSCCN
jgi:hypothetical protein